MVFGDGAGSDKSHPQRLGLGGFATRWLHAKAPRWFGEAKEVAVSTAWALVLCFDHARGATGRWRRVGAWVAAMAGGGG
jgi:hypothetical protein